jgi:integrase
MTTVVPVSTPGVDERVDQWREGDPLSGPWIGIDILNRTYSFNHDVEPDVLWPWLREQLIERPSWIAEKVGIPEIAGLAQLKLPRPSIRLTDLLRTYLANSTAKPKSQRRTELIFEDFLAFTGAKTLAELTTPTLLRFRDSIEGSASVKTGGSRKWMFGQIKNVIAFGKKEGLDPVEINEALSRCAVLRTKTKESQVAPKPISRDHLHLLLEIADDQWRAFILAGLNCCCYIGELIQIKCSYINTELGTFSSIREKSVEERIPRAATLWPETLEAMSRIRSGPDYWFTAQTGTSYRGSASLLNKFAKLRAKAGLGPEDVKFSHLRDGAYSRASKMDRSLARVLAGHQCDGYEDSYVLRHPEVVRPVCDVVRTHYLG